jgi:peptidoglycan L-alanyl-D-glutamate endopeptidase CwlK
MNYVYGAKSSNRLLTCHEQLREIAMLGLERSPYDITIIHGWRGEDIQNALFDSGASTKQYPHSKHNHTDHDGIPLSLAFDFAPWVNGDIPWDDTHIFCVIAGVFIAAAHELGYAVRYGGDWDSDGSTKDQKLMDWGHLELAGV